MVKQSDEYREQERRYAYAVRRRARRSRNVFLLIWSTLFLGLLAASSLDVAAQLGWGLDGEHIRGSALFLAGGFILWAFTHLIDKLLSARLRHIYGPDPGMREE